jgi:hypothetical protein
MGYTRPVQNKKNFLKTIQYSVILIYVTVPTASTLWFDAINLLHFKFTFQPFLKSLVLPAMS